MLIRLELRLKWILRIIRAGSFVPAFFLWKINTAQGRVSNASRSVFTALFKYSKNDNVSGDTDIGEKTNHKKIMG
jgi:hypothetical protein